MTHKPSTVPFVILAKHTTDAHCTVADGSCTTCGVAHGDPCPVCGGRGFHVGKCEGDGAITLADIDAETAKARKARLTGELILLARAAFRIAGHARTYGLVGEVTP